MYNGYPPPQVNCFFGCAGPYDVKLNVKFNNQTIFQHPPMPQFQQQQEPVVGGLGQNQQFQQQGYQQWPLQQQQSSQSPWGQSQHQPNEITRIMPHRAQHELNPGILNRPEQNQQVAYPNYEGRQGRPCVNHNTMFCVLPECESGSVLEGSSISATSNEISGAVQSTSWSYGTPNHSPFGLPTFTSSPLRGIRPTHFWNQSGKYEQFNISSEQSSSPGSPGSSYGSPSGVSEWSPPGSRCHIF